MKDAKRRMLLRGAVAGSALAVAAAAGLLRPRQALAASWPSRAFFNHDVKSVLQNLYGTSRTTASKDILIRAPIQAESGLVVPVSIETSLRAESMSLLATANANALAVNVNLNELPASIPKRVTSFSARIKLRESSTLIAVVKAGGQLYSASTKIKVTVGGCGG